MLRRFTDPDASFVREVSIADRGTDFRELVEPRNLSLDLGRYGKLLDSQKVVSHSNGKVYLEPLFACRIRNALFDTRTGVVCAEDNAMLVESAVDSRRLRRSETYLARIPDRANVRRLEGVYSSIHGLWQNNHFHWLVESLPRLYSLNLWREPVQLLVPEGLDELRRSTLLACLPPNAQVVSFGRDERWLQVEEFIFPSFPVRKHLPIMPREYIEYIRDSILKYYKLHDFVRSGRRVYISRRGAHHGKLVNEDIVIALLERYGFEPYELEAVDIADQVKILRNASIIVAPHGAGLANLIFASRARIVELHNLALAPTYFFLAMIMDNDYSFVLPQQFDAASIPNPFMESARYSQLRAADYSTDVESLQKLVESFSR